MTDTADPKPDPKQATARRAFLTRSNALKVALLAVAGTGVALIVNYLMDDPRYAHFKDLQVVCVANLDDMHGFVVDGKQFVRHLRARTPIRCPECDSMELARAVACVSCERLMPSGAHDLPPDNCPFCGVAQPPPTISDHDKLHAPGAHGEEATIIPLLDDPEPQ